MWLPPMEVPRALRAWFVVHCVLDLVFALPMLIAPAAFLALFGWERVDTAMTRVVAAALVGIGVQSFIGRREGPEAFRGMLNLKLLWSATAVGGLALSGLRGEAPPGVWLFVGVFAAFFCLWAYWRARLVRIEEKA